MTYKNMPCNWLVIVAVLILCSGVSNVIAAEEPESSPAQGATSTTEQAEHAITCGREGDYFLGYRFLWSHDSLKAAEYIYPHPSVTFGLDLLSCPLPYRYHVNAEYLDAYDFYSDAGFAYKDLVLFRDILVGVPHNLEHYDYLLPGEPPKLTYDDRNPGDKYNIDFVSNLASLRLKAPDFPFHTFAIHRHVERNGEVQQRFLLGSLGAANTLEKVSETRDIEWKSDALKLGTNSHVGPVEIEYAHDLAEFEPGPNNILYDTYPASASRPSDIYPHNVVPETESSANSIKLHSSYTGGIVTGATLSNLYEKNDYSQTESTTWKGAVDFSWIPDPMVGLFFKYRHRNVDMDTPDSVSLTGLSGMNPTLNYPVVRKGISYSKDEFSLSARYIHSNILTLFATYDFSNLERKDVDAWVMLPSHSNIHTLNFTAHAKPVSKVKVKAIYEYKNYDHPSYNTTPDYSNKFRLTTNYLPASWVNLYLEYVLYRSERHSLGYLNRSPAVLVETGDRDGRRDQILASLSTKISPKASLSFSWFYGRWDVDQDMTYARSGFLPFLDVGVPYTDEFNSFSLSLQYFPRADITFMADATRTNSEGKSTYSDVVGGAPFSLSSFSELKAAETLLTVEVAKKLSKEWEVRIKSHMDIYDDKSYDVLDGNVFTTIFNIKRIF